MKKIYLFLSIALVSIFASAAILLNSKQATVNQTEGIYIFIGSLPTDEYESLGKVKYPAVVSNNKWETIKKVMIKRTKEQHSTATAIIISDPGELWEWEAVKLK